MKRVAHLVRHCVQWAVFAVLALLTAAMIFMPREMSAAGVSATAFYIALAVFAVVAVAMVPSVFFKLPKRAQVGAYVALIPVFIGVVVTYGAMDTAYAKTPQGRAATEKASAEEAVELRRLQNEEDRRATEALMENHRSGVADIHRRVERCMNWRGQVPNLVSTIKEALHNPQSFQHVETEVVSIGETPAVEMRYRAENGFGAIRTATVRAFISPDDCSVIAIDAAD